MLIYLYNYDIFLILMEEFGNVLKNIYNTLNRSYAWRRPKLRTKLSVVFFQVSYFIEIFFWLVANFFSVIFIFSDICEG